MHREVLNTEAEKIFKKLQTFSDFYLAGGTALALQIGHRKSIDFDLFFEKEIPKIFLEKVKRVFRNERVTISVNNADELTVFVDGIKVTFLKYPFLLVSDLVTLDGIKMLSIKEIGATKAYTIGRRGSLKDYVDLYFILSEKFSNIQEIIRIAQKKYKDEFNDRLFLEQLIYLDDVEDEEILFVNKKVSKNYLKKFFEEEVKKMVL